MNRFVQFVEREIIGNQKFNKFAELEERFEAIKATFTEFDAVQRDIEENDEDVNEDEHINIRQEFENVYFKHLGLSKKMLKAQSQESQSSGGGGAIPALVAAQSMLSNTTSIAKLPEIQLPEFAGSYDK